MLGERGRNYTDGSKAVQVRTPYDYNLPEMERKTIEEKVADTILQKAGEITIAKESVLSGIFVQVCMSLIIAVIGVFGVVGYFEVSTTNSSVIKYGVEYLRPLLIFSFFSCFQITMERLLQSSGLSRYMLYSQLIGTVVNCILDPIFIFTFKLNVAGAAIATVIAQFASFMYTLFKEFKL